VSRPFTFYEFFAGGGMARAGLGVGWDCLFANDFSPVKAATYRANWGDDHFHEGDVHALTPADLPAPAGGGAVDLAWASSPCQDFSLAGLRKGLEGTRSSAFWGFWRLVQGLNREGRAPRVIVIENVVGLLSSHGGADFTALCQALADEGYRFGALEIDAADFVPQSRPRLFVIATRALVAADLLLPKPTEAVQGRRVCEAHARLPTALQALWLSWRAPQGRAAKTPLVDLLETNPVWHAPVLTDRLLNQLSPLHQERLRLEREKGGRRVGMAFRRTRLQNALRVQRAEVRFDGVAGCLRTPGGGSSRQFVIEMEGNVTRSRPLTAREGARLMGLPDSYTLPKGETAAWHVVGDGVVAPVVEALRTALLAPLLATPALAAAE
jgi:DNA (cytosine-5)-methyltransferase 1